MALDKNDLTSIKTMMKNMLDIQREQINEDMEEKMKRHRSNFQEDIDPILKEVQDSRQERVAQNKQITDNSNNIGKLQKAVFKN